MLVALPCQLDGLTCYRRLQIYRADFALTSVYRVPVVVNRRSAQPAETGQTAIGGNNDDEIAIAGNRHSKRAIAAMDSPGTHSASQ
jgi:hypothetical protein